jgi:ParB family chromosome partitioning protein
MAERKRGMGRGLAAILPESSAGGPELRELDVTQIEPNPDQPRAKFDASALDALAGSIGSVGLLQPLIGRSTTAATSWSRASGAGAPPRRPGSIGFRQ